MSYCIVTDFSRCISCYGCMAHCHVKNNLPEGVFLGNLVIHEPKLIDKKCTILSEYETCYNCCDAWCMKLCKTNAIQRDEDGTIWIDDTLCTGCGLCSRACPWHFPKSVMRTNEKNHISKRVAIKCDHCRDLRAEGQNPACVTACTTHALTYMKLEEAPKAFQESYTAKVKAMTPNANAFIKKILAKRH